MKRIIAFTKYDDGFPNITFNYKEVGEDGTIKKENAKASLVVVEEEIKKHISAIEEFLLQKLEE